MMLDNWIDWALFRKLLTPKQNVFLFIFNLFVSVILFFGYLLIGALKIFSAVLRMGTKK